MTSKWKGTYCHPKKSKPYNSEKRPAIFIDVNYNLEVEELDEADKHEGQGDEQCGSNVQDEHVGLGSLFKAS